MGALSLFFTDACLTPGYDPFYPPCQFHLSKHNFHAAVVERYEFDMNIFALLFHYYLCGSLFVWTFVLVMLAGLELKCHWLWKHS